MGDSGFAKREEEILKFWDEQNIVQKSLDQRKGEKLYSFFDGPPFATGLPHYGHILGSVIKDVVGRYWTMKGYYVPRRWGWDCHGLPIENIVEQELKISGKKKIEELGVDVFNATCRDKVLTYAHDWGKMVHRMARWVDFENSYKTMDSTYMESVWWAIKTLWDKGYIYEGRKVLLYCPRCETPISNFEVAMDNSYKDVTEEAVTIAFALVKCAHENGARDETRNKARDEFPDGTAILAWTTTPWTLPSNVALAVNEHVEYVLVAKNGGHYICAKERVEILDAPYEVVREFKGTELVGLEYEPLYRVAAHDGVATHDSDGKAGANAYHIFAGDFVTTEDGTGVVHIATAYGEDDYNLNLTYGLPVVSLLNERGIFTDDAPEFLRGQYFLKASALVIADLEARGNHSPRASGLYARAPHTHQYPHCWRCATALYYSALPAWFIKIQEHKERLMELNESIHWYPEHLKHGRFGNGVLSAPDWNISRNRYWATALPIWKCTNNECTAIACVGSVRELQERATNYGEVYASRDIREVDLHKPFIDRVLLKCETCGSDMARTQEVVDCWVESGSMPFAELHYPFENKEQFEARFPAQFVAEYIAQTRAWFYVMHVMSTLLFDKAPFEHVVTTGNVLNEKGEKLSKSKNNYPDPWEIINTYGVDALRFYLMSSVVMRGENLSFSDKGVDEVYKKIILIARNVLAFYMLYRTEGARDELPAEFSSLHALDRWMVTRVHETIQRVTDELDAYNSIGACDALAECVDDMSTWYLRRSRERFKRGDEQGLKVFGYAVVQISKLMAPIMPFLAEHIYKEAGKGVGGKSGAAHGRESVHLEDWPACNKNYSDADAREAMEKAREYCQRALSLRSDAGIKVRQPLQSFAVPVALGKEFLEIIQQEANVKEVVVDTALAPDEVRLETKLTPELRDEGMVRELVRAVNEVRKNLGMTIHDRAVLRYEIKNDADNFARLIQNNKAEIAKDTLCVGVERGITEQERAREITLGDSVVVIGLDRA